MNNYYKQLGALVIGSYLRRISDRLLNEITEVYKQQNIDFEVGWFHILYLLDSKGELSITDISVTLNMSHPAVIQVTKGMERKGLVKTHSDKSDKRRRIVSLSETGQNLVECVKPLWSQIQTTILETCNEGQHCQHLLPALDELEKLLDKKSLTSRIKSKV